MGRRVGSLESTTMVPGMLTKYLARVFTVKFASAFEANDEYVTWGHLLDGVPWKGVQLELQWLPSPTVLTPQPSKRTPSTADCWDMRRAEWVASDGTAISSTPRRK